MKPKDQAMIVSLTMKGAKEALQFYKKAFNAEVLVEMYGDDGRLEHGTIHIGNTIIYMSDEYLDMGSPSVQTIGGTSITLFLNVENADAAFKQAVDAGAEVLYPVANMPWGSRSGGVKDPAGYKWCVSHEVEELTAEQVKERMKNWKPQN